ncbi:hypothetical protein PBCVNEJV1_795L [Paramecium bursaria Chlorella virus NE-JV-1]|nr:hypothetical protein PBCVNEJV1_795L [Paramecium bursaria Chlorella virus NE-JV-1]
MKYTVYIIAIAIAVIVVIFLTMRKEKFSIQNFLDKLTSAVNDLSATTKKKLPPGGLTAAISNIVAKESPIPIYPKSGFESSVGEEADDTKYIPGFYKIQTNFPMLTKRNPRKFNLMG